MRMFLEKAYELSQKWGCIPVVVTGDLNSLPQVLYKILSFTLSLKQVLLTKPEILYSLLIFWLFHLNQSALYQYVALSKVNPINSNILLPSQLSLLFTKSLIEQLHVQQHDRRQISGQLCSSGYTESRHMHNRVARFFYFIFNILPLAI